MAEVLHIDIETASTADLRKCGVHRYAEDPTTFIWLARYRFDNGPVGEWMYGQPVPDAVVAHIEASGRVIAHNAAFERNVIGGAPGQRAGWPAIDLAQVECTMSRCAAVAIPQSLDFAPQILGLKTLKDREGHALMLRMSRPRKINDDGTMTWWNEADRLQRLSEYCAQDVRTECGVDDTVPALSAREREVWELDQRINDRGVQLDIPTIRRMLDLVEYRKKRLDARMKEVTGGAVGKCSEAGKLAAWITEQGIPCASVAKDQKEDLLTQADNLADGDVRHAIELRAEAARASTAKLEAMLNCACQDGRARGQLNYHGATTGRWAGRLIQPQNLVRLDHEADGWGVEFLIDMLGSPRSIEWVHDMFEATVGNPMDWAAKSMRPMFIARPGTRLVGGDLSNVEGCVNAWLAGETWKVEAYRAYQRGEGQDLYKLAYARTFGIDPKDVVGFLRQIGKVLELALGYQGGPNAFVSMAKNYGVKVSQLVPVVRAVVGEEAWWAQAEKFPKAKDKGDFALEEWTALKLIVGGWREAHPATVQSWWDLQDAAIEAVSVPGVVVSVLGGRIRYLAARGFLWCQLPSGRVLAYCKPRIKTSVVKLIGRDGNEYEKLKRAVEYDGFDGVKKVWGPQYLYGGHQCENVVQAIARDVLVDSMFEAERRGYEIVLTVHDELVTERAIGAGSAAELQSIMSTVPSWAAGLPLAAKCWEDTRYAK